MAVQLITDNALNHMRDDICSHRVSGFFARSQNHFTALIHLDFLSCKLLSVVDDKSDGRKVTMITPLTATVKKIHKVCHAPESPALLQGVSFKPRTRYLFRESSV